MSGTSSTPSAPSLEDNGCVRVRGAREHNLKQVNVDVPRDALVVFTGVSGSGKSSLAFGTVYAEAQRRYFESVAPYARRLIEQAGVPDVDAVDGLPPAVALQQRRGGSSARSSVGSLTTLSNALRMLYSRAGDYPAGQAMLESDAFSPNTPAGACPACHGIGKVFDATEASMVPDPSLTIRERAIAAWPPAWQGKNYRDILVTLGYDVDVPWRDLPQSDRDWILFTKEQPVVPVFRDTPPAEARAAYARGEAGNYKGTYVSAREYVMHTFANATSENIKKRVSRYLVSSPCPTCGGGRLRREALAVTFAGMDIATASQLPMRQLAERLRDAGPAADEARAHPQTRLVAERIVQDLCERIATLDDLGLGYLSLDRSTPTLSPGELQRLRLATQLRAKLFGVVYVLDEPSAGLHPADTEALLRALARLRSGGNSVFVVEHELDVIRAADWLVDIGPDAGEQGGEVLYSGPPDRLRDCTASHTRDYLFAADAGPRRTPREAQAWLRLEGITRNNVQGLDVDVPLGVMTAVTGVSGAGKSSLVSQALVELIGTHLGVQAEAPDEGDEWAAGDTPLPAGGRLAAGAERITRQVVVDQRPIGRTPRSNLATYTGLFDHVRKLFAATPEARRRKYSVGRFSFNVAKGRCPTCEGEGFVSVGLLFLPSVFAPCPTCHGARYNEDTLAVRWNGKNIAEVLDLTVDAAAAFFGDEVPALARALATLRQVGLGYLRLGQPATELSGGEAQRIKLATELQRQARGHTLYVLDEPTTGLHPADVDRLMRQLQGLVEAGHSVLLVEHDLRVIADCDWVIDMGPGAGDEGGRVVTQGTPGQVAASAAGKTAGYLARLL
ncbi:excinuclease ABC subunit UvrA [Oleiagrimonas soli]|uniref:UvrABC system protein A n=1 Tax=Oleiagrimonas soli TaxID=1543381 RepID=A0A099CWW3_9GAMM|nr:excinuclease ABC subunit UvrA [Oleiagrimonas soli]KGI77480.1 excinuclease ABC subunit A [Oleiagrimonas soli]MBB6183067.1 excinuclease ABC subunit A [Oleiagrimonas soli]